MQFFMCLSFYAISLNEPTSITSFFRLQELQEQLENERNKLRAENDKLREEYENMKAELTHKLAAAEEEVCYLPSD